MLLTIASCPQVNATTLKTLAASSPPRTGLAVVNQYSSNLGAQFEDRAPGSEPAPEAVEDAIRTLLTWAGEDPAREGLVDTPRRVARAWREYCRGYDEDPGLHLLRTFEEVAGYDEIVLLKDIPF